MRIYVGNLSPEATGEDLQAAFESFGQVKSAAVGKSKYSGQSQGFGFVRMPNQAEAEAAIVGLKGKELKGSVLVVEKARPISSGRGRIKNR